jgi:hypothetical protein
MNDLDQLQIIATEWAIRCFGIEHVRTKRVRALRLIEEAIEYAQSVGTDAETIHKMVDTIYTQPAGDPIQELGGVMLTTLVAANGLNVMAYDLLFTELRRVLDKSPEHFAERNREKIRIGYT